MNQTAQLRIKILNAITQYGGYGTVFYETPERARFLIDAGIAELLNAGPAEQPQAGPHEMKPMEPVEKKSFAVAQAGPSTDFPESSELGQAAQSSVSLPAQALPKSIVQPLRKRGRPRKST